MLIGCAVDQPDAVSVDFRQGSLVQFEIEWILNLLTVLSKNAAGFVRGNLLACGLLPAALVLVCPRICVCVSCCHSLVQVTRPPPRPGHRNFQLGYYPSRIISW